MDKGDDDDNDDDFIILQSDVVSPPARQNVSKTADHAAGSFVQPRLRPQPLKPQSRPTPQKSAPAPPPPLPSSTRPARQTNTNQPAADKKRKREETKSTRERQAEWRQWVPARKREAYIDRNGQRKHRLVPMGGAISEPATPSDANSAQRPSQPVIAPAIAQPQPSAASALQGSTPVQPVSSVPQPAHGPAASVLGRPKRQCQIAATTPKSSNSPRNITTTSHISLPRVPPPSTQPRTEAPDSRARAVLPTDIRVTIQPGKRLFLIPQGPADRLQEIGLTRPVPYVYSRAGIVPPSKGAMTMGDQQALTGFEIQQAMIYHRQGPRRIYQICDQGGILWVPVGEDVVDEKGLQFTLDRALNRTTAGLCPRPDTKDASTQTEFTLPEPDNTRELDAEIAGQVTAAGYEVDDAQSITSASASEPSRILSDFSKGRQEKDPGFRIEWPLPHPTRDDPIRASSVIIPDQGSDSATSSTWAVSRMRDVALAKLRSAQHDHGSPSFSRLSAAGDVQKRVDSSEGGIKPVGRLGQLVRRTISNAKPQRGRF